MNTTPRQCTSPLSSSEAWITNLRDHNIFEINLLFDTVRTRQNCFEVEDFSRGRPCRGEAHSKVGADVEVAK